MNKNIDDTSSVSWNVIKKLVKNNEACQELTSHDPNRDFFDTKFSVNDYYKSMDFYFTSVINHEFKKLDFSNKDIVLDALYNIYKKILIDDFYLFYRVNFLIDLTIEYYKKPTEYKWFKDFLTEIKYFENHKKLENYYELKIKNDENMGYLNFTNFLYFETLYKDVGLPINYINYSLKHLLHDNIINEELNIRIFLTIFQNLMHYILVLKGYDYKVIIVGEERSLTPILIDTSLKQIYINKDRIENTLEKNLPFLEAMFIELERLRREEIISERGIDYDLLLYKKEEVIESVLGKVAYESNFGYVSNESDIDLKGKIDYIRYLKQISSDHYKKIIDEYKIRIKETSRYSALKKKPTGTPNTLNSLLDDLLIKRPSLIVEYPILQYEYNRDGSRKRLIDLLKKYDELIIDSHLEEDEKTRTNILYQSELLIRIMNDYELMPTEMIYQAINLTSFNPVTYNAHEVRIGLLEEHMINQLNTNIASNTINKDGILKLTEILNRYLIGVYYQKEEKLSINIENKDKSWLVHREMLDDIYRAIHKITDINNYQLAFLSYTVNIPIEDIKDAERIKDEKLKTNEKLNKTQNIVTVIALVIFVVSLGLILSIYFKYKYARDQYDTLTDFITNKPTKKKEEKIIKSSESGHEPTLKYDPDIWSVDFKSLVDKNKDTSAWIKIPDTEINYPVVQTNDNEKYLDTTFEGSKNNAGTLFLDYRIANDFTMKNSVIYGHKMKDMSMFGILYKYKDQKYAEENRFIWIITPKITYKYEVFAAYEFDSKQELYQFYFNHDEYEQYLKNIKSKSVIDLGVEVTEFDQILTLSTCTVSLNDMRYVVVAKVVEKYRSL